MIAYRRWVWLPWMLLVACVLRLLSVLHATSKGRQTRGTREHGFDGTGLQRHLRSLRSHTGGRKHRGIRKGTDVSVEVDYLRECGPSAQR